MTFSCLRWDLFALEQIYVTLNHMSFTQDMSDSVRHPLFCIYLLITITINPLSSHFQSSLHLRPSSLARQDLKCLQHRSTPIPPADPHHTSRLQQPSQPTHYWSTKTSIHPWFPRNLRFRSKEGLTYVSVERNEWTGDVRMGSRLWWVESRLLKRNISLAGQNPLSLVLDRENMQNWESELKSAYL